MSAFRARLPWLALCGAVAVLLTLWAPGIGVVLLSDGLLTAAVLAAALGWGAWPVVWLGLGRRPILQQFCLASAGGLGLLGLITLALGVSGVLAQVVAWTIVAFGWILAVGAAVCAPEAGWPRARIGVRSAGDERSNSNSA